jgi:hypothetical protein
MRIKGEHLHRVRAVTTWAIRAVSFVAVALGLYLFLKKLAFGVGSGSFENVFRIWDGTGEGQSTYRGLSLIAVGLTAGLLAPRLARWIITMPPTGCPACGYSAAAGAPCPECGYRDEDEPRA